MADKKNSSIDKRANLNIIRYSNCWEDADILIKALNPKRNGYYLSIASAGDNSFALLTKSPAMVLSIDLNQTQLSLVELKKMAFLCLNYEELLEFLGIKNTINREKYYSKIRALLSKKTKTFWDNRIPLIEKGIIHIGKFENYFRLFRKWCLPLIHSKKTIEKLLLQKNKNDQLKFYSEKWNNFRWKLLFKIFFSKKIMGNFGRDPEFFKYVNTKVSKGILSRVKYGLSELPTHNNPYLEYIIKGNFKNALPFYLKKENFEKIRKNLDKLILFKGDLIKAINSYPNIKFDGFNLSDIFEYMSLKQYSNNLKKIITASNNDSAIAFWNMLAERKYVSFKGNKIKFFNKKAKTLHRQDKAFFYQAFVVGGIDEE